MQMPMNVQRQIRTMRCISAGTLSQRLNASRQALTPCSSYISLVTISFLKSWPDSASSRPPCHAYVDELDKHRHHDRSIQMYTTLQLSSNQQQHLMKRGLKWNDRVPYPTRTAGGVFISLIYALSPETLKSVTYGQCDARPMVTFPAARHCCPVAGTKLYCLVREIK